MVLWWIGNVILLVVVLPVVIFLLNRVLAAVERIRHATDDILSGGVALVGELNGVPEALAEARKAQQLDPYSAVINNFVTVELYLGRSYQAALAEERPCQLPPGSHCSSPR